VGIVGWLILGLVAGAIARLLVPGPRSAGLGRDAPARPGRLPARWVLADLLFDDESIGLFGSVVGAVLALLTYNAWFRSRRTA